jgi:hypothetical protein
MELKPDFVFSAPPEGVEPPRLALSSAAEDFGLLELCK